MENIPFLLHFCTICVMISPIGLEGLRSFYNKISDNVRGRIPSVMAQNHEHNPSGSKETNPLLRKAIATLTIAATSILSMSACGETHSEPTPDTTTSTAQESESPSPEPSPEVSASSCIKFDGDQELIEDLKSAKTDGEKKNSFTKFARRQIENQTENQTYEPMAETNSMGTTPTSTANLVNTVEQLGRNSTTILEATLNLVADGCISHEDKTFIADSYVSSWTLGQASESLKRALYNAANYPDDNESEKNEVSCEKVLYTAKAKEINGVEQPPHVTRDYLNTAKDIEEGDPLQGTSFKGGTFAAQAVCETKDGGTLIEQTTLVLTSHDENTINNLKTGEQAEIMANPYLSPDAMTKNDTQFASPVILTHRVVNPGSKIPALYKGEHTTLGKIPEIEKALAEREEVRTNK